MKSVLAAFAAATVALSADEFEQQVDIALGQDAITLDGRTNDQASAAEFIKTVENAGLSAGLEINEPVESLAQDADGLTLSFNNAHNDVQFSADINGPEPVTQSFTFNPNNLG